MKDTVVSGRMLERYLQYFVRNSYFYNWKNSRIIGILVVTIMAVKLKEW